LSKNSYYIGMKAILSEKGQVTIPKPLRERLGLRPGQVLDFHEEHGRSVGTKQTREDPIEKVYGVLKTGRTTDEVLRRLRGRADAT
jgi:antitoxin PrlF